ncbi:MAG: arginase [Gammaproteobacteria bacterium]|nr:arginase [Gammaproteobacteria bacterium]
MRVRTPEIHLLGVPLDHGAGRRGVGMGPSALRLAGLHDAVASVGCHLTDLGDLEIPVPETLVSGDPRARYLPMIAAVCGELCERVGQSLARDALPLVVGGDHSLAIGTIAALAVELRARGEQRGPGVLWFDAHADSNTPDSTPSGNIHGMPLACVLGHGPTALTSIGFAGPKIDPRHCALIGVRDVDNGERALLRAAGVRSFSMAEIDRRGMAAVMDEALDHAGGAGSMLHVSFDIDALDPTVAPGTGTAKPGGLTYREAHLAMEMVAESGQLTSLELVEVNPTLDVRNQTAQLAVELIASALGKRIL